MLISPASVWGAVFSPAPVDPEKTRTFSLEDVGSVPTGHTVAAETISFLASDTFPKLPVGKLQIVIFRSCAYDQLHAF